VAGIIAGDGADAEGARARIAPGAHLVVAKVLDDSGRGRISDVIAAFDYVINHQHAYNIRIVDLSIAAGVYESYNSDLFTLAARLEELNRGAPSGVPLLGRPRCAEEL
jgi:serine protease AprX